MKTKLYQVFYGKNQPLDPDCEHIDVIGMEVAPLYENKHILDMYNKGLEGADYYGLVSFRLKEKTNLTKKRIDKFINENNADVYTLYSASRDLNNPLTHSMRSGTDIGKAVKRILELGVFKTSNVEDNWVNVYANYFLAKKEVWDRYIPVLKQVIELGESDKELKEILKRTYEYRDKPYPLFCFVIEYLFGLFLADNPEITHMEVPNKKNGWGGVVGSQLRLMEIYEKYKAPAGFGDKGTLHHYIENYGKLFAPYKDKPVTVLEIGVCQGHSLKMWREYFEDARIIGIDINPPVLDVEGCEFHICDQSSPEQLEKLFKYTKFDIIIDDGTHLLEHMLISHKALYSKVNPGGLYIIEDVGGITHKADRDIQILKDELGDCEVLDTREISGRYDDILMIWKK